MRHIVWKAYMNHEKEEKWLNEMSAKGMALVGYSWCRYVFEDSPKAEYTYRIELLKDLPGNAESRAYLQFLQQTGIEHVASYLRWVYLRKKRAEGQFDLYSDADSKISHYKRILYLWIPIMLLNLMAFISNGLHVLDDILHHGRVFGGNLICIVLNGFFAFLILWMIIVYLRKVQKLRAEKRIHE